MFLPQFSWAGNVPLETYVAITESEFSLSLEIRENGQYQFIHKNWPAGEGHRIAQESRYKGLFKCEGNLLTLSHTDTGEPISGIYRNGSIGELSFPGNKESMILDFTSERNSESIIAGWLYWPRPFSDDLFK